MFPIKTLLFLLGVFLTVQASDRIRLRDVQVLTLKEGKWTAGRRGSPVPQLNCVGGSARDKFVPKVVQCYNRGWDGNEVQWECKTDMDNDYRFGEITVTCEGYDYPGDDYILKGSCGLEYTLDYTKEGWQNRKQGGSSYDYGYNKKTEGTSFSDLVVLFIVGCIIYIIYSWCISSRSSSPPGSGSRPGGSGPGGNDGGPPPPGFRPDYQPPPPYSEKDNHQGSSSFFRGASAPPPPQQQPYTGYGQQGHGQHRNDGPGFWTGLGTGGLLGYMFGGRGANTGYYNQPRHRRSWWSDDQPSSSSWTGGNSRSSWGGGGGGGSSSSSGTRSASGYGGTKVR